MEGWPYSIYRFKSDRRCVYFQGAIVFLGSNGYGVYDNNQGIQGNIDCEVGHKEAGGFVKFERFGIVCEKVGEK